MGNRARAMTAGCTRREAVRLLGASGASLILAGCGSVQPETNPVAQARTRIVINDVSAPTSAAAQAVTRAPESSRLDQLLSSMTLEQKVAQLFFVTPEQLTGADVATVAGDLTRASLEELPVGGIVYFSQNITGDEQLRSLVAGTVELSRAAGAGIPAFIGVDEEGGPLVARVANSGYFDVEQFPNMANVGASGDETHAARVGASIGGYLHDLGFTVDFAPDADVLTNPDNTAIGKRSFGSDPELVARMVSAEVKAMEDAGVLPCVKHFPGHGDTVADSHSGEAVSTRTLEQLRACEYLPFSAAIGAGVPFVMVGHIKTPNAAADDLPASLSEFMIGKTLREELGFEGVIITDSFRMGAISQYYEPGDAAVRYLAAGGDMVLMPEDLRAAYEGVLAAVAGGAISEARIDESVRRVLAAKQAAGMLDA